jgi:hypothetical protein
MSLCPFCLSSSHQFASVWSHRFAAAHLGRCIKGCKLESFSRIYVSLMFLLLTRTQSMFTEPHCEYICDRRQAVLPQRRDPDSQRQHSAVLTTVEKNWRQPVSLGENAGKIHKFRSLTSSNTLKSFTCASRAERVRYNQSWASLLSYRGFLPNVNCIPPAMPFTDGPLEGVHVDRAGVFWNDNDVMCLTLCPHHAKLLSFETNFLGSRLRTVMPSVLSLMN